MGDTSGAFDPTRKEASLAPPTTHQYIPSAGPPEEEKKDDVDNVNYFLSNLMMGQGTPGSFPMPAAPEKKPEDEKVQFMPPFIPMPMQAPPPEKEPKDKKKTSQPLPFMPPYNSGGPGPAFIAPPPGFAYPFPAPWFYGGVPAPYYPMPIYCYPGQGHVAGPPAMPAAAMMPQAMQQPPATYQPTQLTPGAVPYMGATAEEVQGRNHALAAATGACGPFTLAPYKAEPGQQFWCQELDGTWSLRTQNDIEENCKPGAWMPTASGTVAWMRAPVEEEKK